MPGLFKYKVFVLTMAFFLLSLTAGCNGDIEEETYNVETDEEFQQSVEQVLERFLREDNEDVIYQELLEEYGERYTEEEIRVYVGALLEEQEEELSAELEAVKEQVDEAQEKVNEFEEELTDETAREELEEQLKPLNNWLEELEKKIEETTDFYRKVELYEEMENTLLQIAEILENKVTTLEEREGNTEEGAGAFFSYNHEIEELLDHDKEIQEAYNSVTGDNFISEQVLHDELEKNIIPESEDLLDQLGDIDQDTEEIQEVHQKIKEAQSTLLQGYNLWVEAIQEEDQDMVDEAVELVEKGKELRQTFYKELDILLQKYTN